MNRVHRVFVYGTLRQYESNHYLLNEVRCLSRQCWTNGSLYDTGVGFPAMVKSAQNRVYGELYEVTPQQLERLDRLEGYEGEGKNNLYERMTQVVYTNFDAIEAYVYIYSSPNRMGKSDEITSGDWKCRRYLQQNELLYFAYGSCMDNERFNLAGVNHQFERVLGCGMAMNYSLAYTRKARDGGRADLIESNENTEGKLYLISSDALAYLYGREGVLTHIYRPAFIDVVMDGKLFRNVLTFLVIDKTKEVAPPMHYVTELLRGAKGFVSDSYYQKLVNELNDKFQIKQ